MTAFEPKGDIKLWVVLTRCIIPDADYLRTSMCSLLSRKQSFDEYERVIPDATPIRTSMCSGTKADNQISGIKKAPALRLALLVLIEFFAY